jgi:hypothetical protein
MHKRSMLIALGLTLAACNQGAAPADPAAETVSPGSEQPAAAGLLARASARGSWAAVAEDATTAVRFTAPDIRETLTIGCNDGLGQAFVVWTPANPIAMTNPADERFPTEDGEVQITTAARTVTFSGTGSNIDGAMVSLAAAGDDPRFAVLTAQQDRFAVQAFGQTIVVPWSSSIADALNACAR